MRRSCAGRSVGTVMRTRRPRAWALLAGVLCAVLLSGCAAAAASVRTPAPGGRVVVTIGDSIMAGYGLDDGEDWPTQLSSRASVGVDNLACSGAGFVTVGSCGSSFAGLIPQAVKDAPMIVIVQGSDNDVGQSDADIEAATEKTVDALHRALPKAQLIGLSTLWDPDEDEPQEITETSAAVKRAVTAVHGTYVDIGQPLREDPSTLLQDDHEHPTVAGQHKLLVVIRKELARAGHPL